MTAEQLRATVLRLTDFRGVAGTVEIPLDTVVFIEGQNGTGKSSRVSAFAALTGEDLADAVHDGAESAEIVLELSDGTVFRRTIQRDGKTALTASNPKMGKIGSAKAYLTSLITSAALNPARFLQADDAEAAEYVLRLAPLTVTRDEIAAAVGDVQLPQIDVRGHALRVLDSVGKLLYDQRTGENRAAKDARTTVEQLGQSLPADLQDPSTIETEIDALTARGNEIKAKVKEAEDAAWAEVRDRNLGRLEALDARIAELERELAATQAERRTLQGATESEQLNAARATVPELRQELADIADRMTTAREALRTAASLAAAVANTRKLIAAQQEKADAAHAASQALTRAMAEVDALKAAKAADLPIRGVSIRDGRLYIGERPASRANTAERVKVALQVCVRQDAAVKLIVADSLESLDAKTRAQLEAGARKAGIQILAGRVSDADELTVRTAGTDEPEFAAVGGAT